MDQERRALPSSQTWRITLSNPLFTIVIPLYNRKGFIKRTVESVLEQTFGDFEVIVVDDGSTDGSGDVVESIDDDRVKYFRKENEERSIARNTGTLMAEGKYVSFLDSDDYLYPNHLAEASSMIDRYDDPEFFHLGYSIKDINGALLQDLDWLPERANQALVSGNHLSVNGVFLRSDIARANLFDPSMSIHEDYELWLRLASKHPLICSNTITSVIIAHDDRSLLTVSGAELIRNINRFEEKLFADADFQREFRTGLQRIKSNNRVHIALHYAVTKESRLKAVTFLIKGLATSPKALINRAFYGTIKRMFV